MKNILLSCVLVTSVSAFAEVNCKLLQGNSSGEVVEVKMNHLNGASKHKFIKNFAAGKLASYSVEIDKLTEDIRVEVKSDDELVLTSWSSFDSTNVMQIERREDNGSSTMIYCEK